MTRLAALAGMALALGLWAAPVKAADLAAARSLYGAASYEEALVVLSSLEQTENIEQVNELRALCYLALGRMQDAEQATVRLVMHNPAYRIEQADVSPKLVALFHDVRRRRLPDAARAVYAKAKAHYDAKRWADAKSQFSALVALLNEPDAATQRAALADLTQLADGFLTLIEGEMIAENRRAADAAAAAAAAATAKAEEATRAEATRAAAAAQETTAAATPVVYSADNADVVPPVELRRVMPPWIPPSRAMAARAHSGLLVLVIDETGAVRETRVAKPITPAYDRSLLDLARTWRYKPATKGGQPVRYRQVLEIVLRPTPP